jgi:hypothetical protein
MTGGTIMNILAMAKEAGLQVLLDARIGNQTYHSVSGSLPALRRFADAVRAATLSESPRRTKAKMQAQRHLKRHLSWEATMRARRARRRALQCGGRYVGL